ncbi:MEDS domain-containing protein [Streptomyces daliensis]|uniref:MEDS domain-containing protein n=1 Tax=Streptomyces daliensis TaxID=299421 RepID=A0A8T4IN27_9ACTN|nr:MEDS domain-containing protein [Streptomyces daliensis]
MSEVGAADYGDRLIPVQRMRPGDHAFTAYESEADQWGVISAFVRQGLIEGEKVLVFMSPEVTGDELLGRLESRTPAVVNAWAGGQLVLSSMRALIEPDTAFTAARQWQRLIEEADLAVRQGYPAMRAYIDMAWVADLGTDVQDVMRRERSATHLFDGGRPYSEICAYDGRWFSTDVLDAMLDAHPTTLLDRLGSLRVIHSSAPPGPDGTGQGPGMPSVRLVGEADVSTGAEFSGALRAALSALASGPSPGAGLHVDLTSLHFLGVGCAADLLRLSAEAGHARVRLPSGAYGAGGGRSGGTVTPGGADGTSGTDGTGGAVPGGAGGIDVTVNCTPFQARTLRRLGADSISSLTLAVEKGPTC